MNDRVLDVLAQAAGDRAKTLVPSPAPMDRVGAAVHQDQVRRRAAAVVGAALSLVLIVAVAFAAVPRLTAAPVIPAVPYPTYPTVRGTVSVGGVDWPLAGDLVTDPDFVAGAARQFEQSFTSMHPGSKTRATVLFAGDLGAWRVVVAQDPFGEPGVAFGPSGADPTLLDFAGTRGVQNGDPGGPITVLLPDDGEGSHLLVLAPARVSVEVADSLAVWPERVPPYRPAPLRDGVAVLPFDPAPPFAAWPNALAARGRSTSGPISGWTFGIGAAAEDDVLAQYSEYVRPWAAGLRTAVQLDAESAADQALHHGRFAAKPTLTLRASAVLGSNLTAGVVDATTGGVRSRALSVSITNANGSAGSSLSYDPALSLVDVIDPRPLLVQDLLGEGEAPVSVVWVASPNAQLTVQTKPQWSSPETKTLTVTTDDRGFALISARVVNVVAVVSAAGTELWNATSP